MFFSNSSDYAVVIVGGVLLFAGGWWIVSARKWFHGPVVTVESGTSHPTSESEYISEK